MRTKFFTVIRKVILTACILSLTLVASIDNAGAETTLYQKSRNETFSKLGDIPKPKKSIRVGVVLITLANPFWVSIKEGYQQTGKEFGIEMDLQASPQENSVTDQLNLLENMVTKNYDVIVAHPITSQNIIPGLLKASEKGIPTVTENRVDMKAAKEAGVKAIYIEMVNFYEQGKMGAEYIVKLLKKKNGGKVAIIEGLPGAPQSEARTRGARKAFESDSSIKLVSVQPGDWDRSKAYNITSNLLQAHPDLKGIMCSNDVMALAAVEAIKAARKTGKIIVVGIDLIPQAKEAIEKGQLAGSVAFSPFLIGELFTRVAVAAYEGKKIPDGVSVTSVLATKDNIHLLKDWK